MQCVGNGTGCRELDPREAKRENVFMYQHASQRSVAMTKCFRELPSNKERLIWFIVLAISEHGWLALSALTVVRQDVVAGACDRVRSFSSR